MGAGVGLLFGLGLFLILNPGRPRRGQSSSRLRTRRTEMLHQAGIVGVSPAQLAGLQVVAAVVVALAVLTLTRTPAVAAAFGIFGAMAPLAVAQRARRRRSVELREVWPEVVDNLASAVRAGLSLPEALAALGSRGPEPLREPFARFGADYRATGRFGGCLDRLKAALADPVADRILESLRMTREVGGSDLGRLLRTLSTFLREDARARAELETRQGWTVNAARLAVAAPWVVLLLLASQSAAIQAYNSTGGVVVLAVGGAVSFVAYRMMLRIGRLPDEQRVLR
jgi:tight adherence protein B